MKRTILGLLALGLTVPSTALADDDNVPLVPFTVQMQITTPVGWFEIEDMHLVVLGEGTPGVGEDGGLIGFSGKPIGRWWNCVAVGGFGQRHTCKVGKTKRGGCLVRLRLGHDAISGPALMTIRHTLDRSDDVRNWRSYALNVPESVRGGKPLASGDPKLQLPAPVVEPKLIRTYRSVSGDLADVGRPSLAEAAIRQHVAQLVSQGCDWILFEWDGPDSLSDRLLRTLLPVALEQNLPVVPTIRCSKGQTSLLSWTSVLVAGHGRHPAIARVDGKPVVFFARQTAEYFTVDMWKKFFAKYAQRNIKSFNVVEGYEPGRLAYFDGVYCNPTSEVNVTRLRHYVKAYVHARFYRKAFVARAHGEIGAGMAPGHQSLVAGFPPTWVIVGDQPIEPAKVARAAASQPTAKFAVAGYLPLAARKHYTPRRIRGASWNKDLQPVSQRPKEGALTDELGLYKPRKTMSWRHIRKHSWDPSIY